MLGLSAVEDTLNLRNKLRLSVGEYNNYYGRVLEALPHDLWQELRPIAYRKLSVGNQNPPLHRNHLLTRVASLMRALVQNPRGIKSLRGVYCRRRRGDLRPPRTLPASGSSLRHMARVLVQKGYLARCDQGLYTTTKGKELLVKCL